MNSNTLRTVLTLCATTAAIAAKAAKPTPETLVYDQVILRPANFGSQDPGAAMADAIRTGNIAVVDALLDKGLIGIDEPICLSLSGMSGALMTSTRTWTLASSNLAADANKVLNPTGDPMSMPFIPDTPGMSFSAPGWTANSGARTMYGSDTAVLHGTPLMIAARNGNPTMVRHLLKRKANPTVFIEVGGAINLPYSAIFSDGVAIQRPWLFALSETYRMSGGKQKPRSKMDQIAELLIKAGAVLPPEDGHGWNGLWDAAVACSVPMLELALSSGLDINSTDNLGNTVAECRRAVSGLPGEAIFRKALMDHGAGLTTDGDSETGPTGKTIVQPRKGF